jgi:signal transduction histidine kinase
MASLPPPAALPPGDAERANLSLHAATLLRDRAERVTARVGRNGRPRERFLREQRARLAAWFVPTFGTIAALTGALGALELRSAGPAAVLQASLAIVIGAGAIAASFAKKTTAALVGVVTAVSVLGLLGWGVIVRMTTPDDGPSKYLLVLPLLLVVEVAILPLPPRVATVLGVAGYGALLVANPGSRLIMHFLMIAAGVGGYFITRGRHRQIVRAFLRSERLTAAVRRMRRVQEQLVVVEKLEALRVLVGGMAHELNNSLAISLASTQQAVKNLPLDPNAALGALKRSEGGLARIKATVDRLRRFAMAADGVLEPADVASMLDFALESAIGRARSGVVVERDYDPKVGALECHVSALAEALFQVARNAVEAMPGGGTLKAAVTGDTERVVMSVSDEGKGIPPAMLKKVFDPYFRATDKGNKSGMGLSAVYGLVSAMGGSVKLQSKEGAGTTVAITMPRKKG